MTRRHRPKEYRAAARATTTHGGRWVVAFRPIVRCGRSLAGAGGAFRVGYSSIGPPQRNIGGRGWPKFCVTVECMAQFDPNH
jgi:hypothetical protein